MKKDDMSISRHKKYPENLIDSVDLDLVYSCRMCGSIIKKKKDKHCREEILHECEGLDSYRMGIAYLIGFERKDV